MTISINGTPTLRVGDLVQVLDAEEIMATLDEKGELDNLPFMPEMLRYCGRRMTVHKVAHKLCDTQTRTGLRRMERAVHLTGARCDGGAHGGCQTACSLLEGGLAQKGQARRRRRRPPHGRDSAPAPDQHPARAGSGR